MSCILNDLNIYLEELLSPQVRYISCSLIKRELHSAEELCKLFLTGSKEMCRAPECLKFKLIHTALQQVSQVTSLLLRIHSLRDHFLKVSGCEAVQSAVCSDGAEVSRESLAANAGQMPSSYLAPSRRSSYRCASPCLSLRVLSAMPEVVLHCWGAVSIDPPVVQPSLTKATGWGDVLAQAQLGTQELKQPQSSCFLRPAFQAEAKLR